MGIRRRRGSSNRNRNNLATQPVPVAVVSPLSRATQLAAQFANVASRAARRASVAAPQVAAGRRSSTIAVFPARVPKPPAQDVQNISETSLVNGLFEGIEKNGISAFRPEVVAVTNFKPIYNGDPKLGFLTPVGQLLDLQTQLLQVREATFIELLQSIESWNKTQFDTSMANATSVLQTEFQTVARTIEYYKRFITATQDSKAKFDLSNIPTSAYDSKNFMSLEDFAETTMQFDKTEQANFTNTKLYLQLCSDFRAVLENYSFSLLNLVDSDRINNTSPVNIDTTYTTRDNFTFSIDSIRNSGNAAEPSLFAATLNSLPVDPSDRIKLITTLLSKEYRSSKNITKSNVSEILLQKYASSTTQSPYRALLGVPGATIFDKPSGNTVTLSSLARVETGANNTVVLPFEQKFIDQEQGGTTTYVPGSSYYVDSVLTLTPGNTSFNTQPLTSFSDAFFSVASDTKTVIEELLEIPVTEPTRLHPGAMIDGMFESVANAMSGLQAVQVIDVEQGTIIALLKLANTDTQLKNMMFQFVLFSAIVGLQNQDSKEVFKILGQELSTAAALSYVRKIAKLTVSLTNATELNTYSIYLEALAQDIEDRVFFLVAKRPIPSFRSLIPGADGNPVTADRFSSVDVLNTPAPDMNRRVLFLKERRIKAVLMSCVRPSGTTTSTNLFKEFFAVANELSRAASTNGNANYLLPDGSGKTRMNAITTSMQLLLLFEVFSSFAERYAFVKFGTSRYTTAVVLDVDVQSTKLVVEALKSIVKTPVPVALQKGVEAYQLQWRLQLEAAYKPPLYGQLRHTLSTIKTKVMNEDAVVANFLHVIDVFGKSIQGAKTTITTTFNSKTLQEFLSENSSSTLDVVRNPTQVRTSVFLFEQLREKIANSDNSNVVSSQRILSQQELRLLKTMLADAMYTREQHMADERLRILTVGMPAGLSKTLSDRVTRGQATATSTGFLNKQSDVVKINVYKRDARYSDIVFKPKSFLFDLSLFQSEQNIKDLEPKESETFQQLVERAELMDYQQPAVTKPVTWQSITTNPEYSFLTNTQKRELVANHIQSRQLANYMELITSMKLCEEAFVIDETITPGTSTTPSFDTLIRNYLASKQTSGAIPNENFASLLQNQSLLPDTQDSIRLATYGSLSFEPALLRQQIIQPKLFDRVFHIPVSTEGYEVDLDLTVATESGKRALRQSFVQNQLIEVSSNTVVFKSIDPQTDIVFADFFVTVEPVNLLN